MMNGWLLDTNIISELRKTNCHPAVTLAEIRFGIEQLQEDRFRQELTEWLDATLRPWFSDRLLAISEDVILRWRHMVEKGRKQGHTFSQPDLFIAATASVHHLCVVTRNVGDFEKAQVPVLNPFLYVES